MKLVRLGQLSAVVALGLHSTVADVIDESIASELFPPNVLGMMNLDVDPCDNLYEFACGGWLNKTKVPEDKNSIAYSFGTVQDAAENVLRELFESDAPVVGDLFKSCMDTDTLTALGYAPIEEDLKGIEEAKSPSELMTLCGKLTSRGMGFLTSLQEGSDYFNSSTYVLFMTTGKVTLPNPAFYANGTFQRFEKPLATYITTLFKLIGVPLDKAAKAAEAVVRVESQFNSWADAPMKRPYDEITVEDAIKTYPLLMGSFLNGTGALTDSLLEPTSPIVNMQAAFFDELEKYVADETNLEDLRTYITYRWINSNVDFLSPDFNDASFQFYSKALNGILRPPPRWKGCVASVTTHLPARTGKYFADKIDAADTEATATKMIERIEHAMAININSTTWLDDWTRLRALTKLRKVSNLIGHSDRIESFAFAVQPNAFAENHHNIEHSKFIKSITKVGKVVDKTDWKTSIASSPNAHYAPLQNQMLFPIGIFQKPFFDASSSWAQNFGAIGSVMGHELLHGFDSFGRLFDGDGNFNAWWTAPVTVEFQARAKCMQDQYSTFAVNGSDGSLIGHVNGASTLGENVADNGGIKLAYHAYHEFLNPTRRLQHQKTGKDISVPASGLESSQNHALYFDPVGTETWANPDQPNQFSNQMPPMPITAEAVRGSEDHAVRIKSLARTDRRSLHALSIDETERTTPTSTSREESNENSRGNNSAPIPRSGIKYENDQLFFVAYAQTWCTKKTDATIREHLLSDPHTPPEWRVNGVTMNSRAFSQVFRCAVSKPMNPRNKCEVW